MSEQKQLSIGMNILGLGGHQAAWRTGEVPPSSITDPNYFINIAKLSERGTLDAIFLADGPQLGGDVSKNVAGRLEPTVLLTAVAAATTHIGVISTLSSSYNEPFNLARRVASVDHISHGRAAWNLVTNAGDGAAQNFGLDEAPLHVDRYDRAAEFAEVVIKLWDSWEDDAIIGDWRNGHYADRSKVHEINHRGRFFNVQGPLNVSRSPQGRPVIFQAGASEGGKAVGSRYADAIFCTQTTLEGAIEFYNEMKTRARAWGRNPDHLKIMPGISTVIGSTEEEAERRREYLDAFEGNQGLITQISGRLGLKPEELDIDAPLPWSKLGDLTPPEKGSHGFFDAQIKLAKAENLTVRQLARRIRSGHRLVVGAPEQVADTIEQWFRAGAADGFNLMPDVFPSGAEIFVDHVVPILRKRGIFRHEYTGTTLREHLGLPKPVSQFSASQVHAIRA
jgi:FMN-dependent oxidoreductase (nitrilotriacetate monooxygenase family)